MLSPVAQSTNEPAALSRWLSSDFDVGFALEATDGEPFQAQFSSFSLGPALKLARLAFSPHRTRRVLRTARPPVHYLVNRIIEGQAFVRQDGREAEVSAGDIYLINPARDFELETGSIVTNSLYVDANAFRSAFPEVDCCAAIAFRREDHTTAMVSAMIDSLFNTGDSLSGAARQKSGEAFPHVLAIALAANVQDRITCPSRLMLFHKERIKSFVRDRLGCNDLGCDMIADALKLSPRYIYDVFADEPLTLMRWIRHERLARCHRELSSPALRNRTISEIAFAWGFIDLAHFSRVFSAEYGLSPRAFRQRAMSAAPLLN